MNEPPNMINDRATINESILGKTKINNPALIKIIPVNICPPLSYPFINDSIFA